MLPNTAMCDLCNVEPLNDEKGLRFTHSRVTHYSVEMLVLRVWRCIGIDTILVDAAKITHVLRLEIGR
jgi:hypothetical protein